MALNTVMLSVYAERRKEAHLADCCYAECRYAECYYAECRGALFANVECLV